MNKLFKPANFLFYFLSIIVFFVVGLYVAKLVGAGKGQMLAGGAIVLFYGLVSSVIAFILALIVANNVNHKTIIAINKILGLVFFLLVCLITYKIITRDKKEDPVKELPKKTTAPAVNEISMLTDCSY